MAYFRCVGGVGGGAVLTLTYSSEFYGQTITATDGTKTVTKVAPSTGTMDITLPESGTWVVSATIDGQTYSTTVTVDIGYSATLFAIPNGSTVTPTDDIQTWLKCAGITDKTTYTTLADVLADTDTFIALCADSNACDYMARSTNWASGVAADSTAMLIVGKYNYCANALLGNSTWASAIANSSYSDYVISALVPTMTSNTTPSGVVSSKDVYQSGYEAYKAFDGNSSTQYIAAEGTDTKWLQYQSTEPVCVNKIIIYSSDPLANIKKNIARYELVGSNDGTTWSEPIATLSTDDITSGNMEFIVGNKDAYTYHRVNEVKKTPYGIGYHTVQFYGRTNTAEYVPLVPIMTSNTTPSGVCSASSTYTGYDAYKAFDGDNTSVWSVASGETSGWLEYKFPTAQKVNKVEITPHFNSSTGACAIKDFEIRGSNDDFSTYTTLHTGVIPNGVYSVTTFTYTFENTVAFESYRLYINDCYSGISPQVRTLQLYTAHTHTLIHSAVEDNIFYMDDGSPVALCGIPVGDTIDVDMESFKGQTLTLVSTVAKDPTNLSNDFSMNVRITPNITEIYLMPYGALYWWGSEQGIEDSTTANGWSNSAYTLYSATHNKNNIYCTTSAGYNAMLVGNKKAVYGSTAKTIIDGQGFEYWNTSKYLINETIISPTSGAALHSASITGNQYYAIGTVTTRQPLTISAMWIE
jgi:hypothetical protein